MNCIEENERWYYSKHQSYTGKKRHTHRTKTPLLHKQKKKPKSFFFWEGGMGAPVYLTLNPFRTLRSAVHPPTLQTAVLHKLEPQCCWKKTYLTTAHTNTFPNPKH